MTARPGPGRHGIPTTHRATRFRSRLEARWACFFDLIGWRWEYEPFDADGYVPDFAILGGESFLVEVKPALALAELAEHVDKVKHAGRDTLLVGVAPVLPYDDWRPCGGVLIQWSDDVPYPSEALWHRCGAPGCSQLAVHHLSGGWVGYPCGHYDGDHYLGVVEDSVLERAWAAARNSTQWAGA